MLAFPGCSPCGGTRFLGWIKVHFTAKHRKYEGNEKIEDRIRLYYDVLTKVFAHIASINAEELTPTLQIDKTGRVLIILYPQRQ